MQKFILMALFIGRLAFADCNPIQNMKDQAEEWCELYSTPVDSFRVQYTNGVARNMACQLKAQWERVLVGCLMSENPDKYQFFLIHKKWSPLQAIARFDRKIQISANLYDQMKTDHAKLGARSNPRIMEVLQMHIQELEEDLKDDFYYYRVRAKESALRYWLRLRREN